MGCFCLSVFLRDFYARYAAPLLANQVLQLVCG
jgi:hypothetical protein